MSTETPGTPVQEAPPTPQAQGAPSKDEQTMGMLAHLLGLVGFLGPLIIWLIKKEESAYVAEQAKESLNFQLTVLIAQIVAGVLWMVFIGMFLSLGISVYTLIYIIIASMQANQGILYKYPISIRFIK